MSLSEEMMAATQAFVAQMPKDTQEDIGDIFQGILDSNIGENALRVGNAAKPFTLPNATGGQTNLSDLTSAGPVVLSFYRGGWCPYCNMEFKALNDIVPQIKELGAQLVGISPELPDQSMSTKEKHSLQFEVLSDVGNQVAKDYGIVMNVPERFRPYYLQWGLDVPKVNGDDSWELPIPATFIIDNQGTIRDRYINKDYRQRMEPEDIIKALSLF